ncbi:MAG: hypothetical protein ACRCTA_07655, partial [Bacilli bacterium]
MFNLIYSNEKAKSFLMAKDQQYLKYDINIKQYINQLCLIDGSTLKGKIMASKLVSTRKNESKLPIYFAVYHDFLVPLYGLDNEIAVW